MIFNSIEYLFFLPLVVAGYFLIPHRGRWLVLLLASYAFYMSWNPYYVVLLIGSTGIDYIAARMMDGKKDKKARRPYLRLSVLANLTTLFIFKYLGFFNELARDLAGAADLDYTVGVIDLMLPLGISFYTFQSLSYTIDIYRGTRTAEKHFGYLAVYVSFFPQLIAGPIERSTTLLPQLRVKQEFIWANLVAGLRLILWGLFKKIAIADKMAPYTEMVYNNPENFHGFTWVIVGFGFMAQILFDFSAYSDIAIGSAKIFGYDLCINFNRPLQATSMKEFWKRWHISMTQWFFDYFYKPLSRKLRFGWQLNIFIFLVILGFWHGATWGFVLFGVGHAIFYIISDYLPVFESEKSKVADVLLKLFAIFGVFFLNSSLSYFFRAHSLSDAFYGIKEAGLGLISFDYSFAELGISSVDAWILSLNLGLYIIIQSLRNHDPKNPFSSVRYRWLRWGIYYFIFFMTISLAHTQTHGFLYFQF